MQELSWQRSSSSSSGKASSPPRLEGRFSYKMIKAQPVRIPPVHGVRHVVHADPSRH
jgi:hypothetical protein